MVSSADQQSMAFSPHPPPLPFPTPHNFILGMPMYLGQAARLHSGFLRNSARHVSNQKGRHPRDIAEQILLKLGSNQSHTFRNFSDLVNMNTISGS